MLMPRQEWPPAEALPERVEGLPLLLTGATFDALEAAAGRCRLSPGELVHQLIAAFLGQGPAPPSRAPSPAAGCDGGEGAGPHFEACPGALAHRHC
jgi:hypothetical protein